MLLEDIYQCAQNGGSALVAAFPGEITRQECQDMNTLLLNNRLPVLLTAGLPEATPIAHKHGWVTVNGVINTIGDADIYFSRRNYILVVFYIIPNSWFGIRLQLWSRRFHAHTTTITCRPSNRLGSSFLFL
jgi:hypothetical protein